MNILYSTFGRICHGFWGMGPDTYGAHVIDDFGNSVKVKNGPISFFLRGPTKAPQQEF